MLNPIDRRMKKKDSSPYFISHHRQFHMVMALFISSRILFHLLLLFTIIHVINSYRIHQYENVLHNINDIQNDRQVVQLRSVLWPKICFKMLKEHRGSSRALENNHVWQKRTRKCYPFDMR
jgi:hypothetical protein